VPLIHAYLADGPSVEQKQAFLRAVTAAAVSTLGVSEQSVRVWITPIAEEHYMAAGVSLMERRAAERAAAESVT
jgi:4-oxalocrotonate tautomerase family enzyme